MKKSTMNSAIFITAMMAGGSVSAQETPPIGIDIEPRAAMCGIGPHPQTGKAGAYNNICTTLQDGEKCLALIKFQLADGNLKPSPSYLKAQAEYCLELFKQDLLAE